MEVRRRKCVGMVIEVGSEWEMGGEWEVLRIGGDGGRDGN